MLRSHYNGDTYFKVANEWYKYSDSNYVKVEHFLATGVCCVTYDVEDLDDTKLKEDFCYIGQELITLRNRTSDRLSERHLNTEKRNKEDRHLEKGKDHHLNTEKRNKEDRH